MKKNLLLYVLVVFLIVVNGFFLFNYMDFGSAKKQEQAQKPADFLLKELKFNDSQIEQFKNENQDLRDITIIMSDEVRNLKDKLFSNLSNIEVNELEIDSLATLIGNKEKEKEKKAFYYFKSIYDICNDEQKEKFKKIIKDALRRGDDNNRPPPPNRGGGEHPGPPPHMEDGGHMPPPPDHH